MVCCHPHRHRPRRHHPCLPGRGWPSSGQLSSVSYTPSSVQIRSLTGVALAVTVRVFLAGVGRVRGSCHPRCTPRRCPRRCRSSQASPEPVAIGVFLAGVGVSGQLSSGSHTPSIVHVGAGVAGIAHRRPRRYLPGRGWPAAGSCRPRHPPRRRRRRSAVAGIAHRRRHRCLPGRGWAIRAVVVRDVERRRHRHRPLVTSIARPSLSVFACPGLAEWAVVIHVPHPVIVVVGGVTGIAEPVAIGVPAALAERRPGGSSSRRTCHRRFHRHPAGSGGSLLSSSRPCHLRHRRTLTRIAVPVPVGVGLGGVGCQGSCRRCLSTLVVRRRRHRRHRLAGRCRCLPGRVGDWGSCRPGRTRRHRPRRCSRHRHHPMPSLSASSCPGLGVLTQLSIRIAHAVMVHVGAVVTNIANAVIVGIFLAGVGGVDTVVVRDRTRRHRPRRCSRHRHRRCRRCRCLPDRGWQCRAVVDVFTRCHRRRRCSRHRHRPMPSPSVSSWPGLGVLTGSCRRRLHTPSSSTSVQPSQASPKPSPSRVFLAGVGVAGQLSTASSTPSPSESVRHHRHHRCHHHRCLPGPGLAVAGQLSRESSTPSSSVSSRITGIPETITVRIFLTGVRHRGQLSSASSTPSPSVSFSASQASPAVTVAVFLAGVGYGRQLSSASSTPSPSDR